MSIQARAEWKTMPEELQAALAHQAMQRAALIVAEQAELFAVQFQAGILHDRGSADALRLFATLLRETTASTFGLVGHA